MNGFKSAVNLARRFYSLQNSTNIKQLTIQDIYAKYRAGTPISMITAYDYITSYWAHAAGADMVLVGDSVAMCSLGYQSTTDMKLDEFKYHVSSVCRAPGSGFTVVDIPFGSFEKSIESGVQSAIELMQLNNKVQAIKIECGTNQNDYALEYIYELVRRGIPVMGHIGLTPQRSHSLSGYKVQGNKESSDALALYRTSQKLQKMGCFALLLECIPHRITSVICERLCIPTIGIGAGPSTSGQVLVQSDALGMLPGHKPKFVNAYGDMKTEAISALSQYVQDVGTRSFPDEKQHSFKVRDEVYAEFLEKIDQSVE